MNALQARAAQFLQRRLTPAQPQTAPEPKPAPTPSAPTFQPTAPAVQATPEAPTAPTVPTSSANDEIVINGFMARGIPAEQIIPRENVFTFAKWLDKGRAVRKGEHGIQITVINEKEETTPDGDTKKRRHVGTATVFHITQTEETTDCPKRTRTKTTATTTTSARQLVQVSQDDRYKSQDPGKTTAKLLAQIIQANAQPNQRTVYISSTDAAKLIRSELKAQFPETTFSVTTSKYSGGASISIRWEDGPTGAEVDKIGNFYQGKGPMDNTDYCPSVSQDIDGKRVSFYSDYIHTSRTQSAEFLREVANLYKAETGNDAPEIKTESDGKSAYFHARDYEEENRARRFAAACKFTDAPAPRATATPEPTAPTTSAPTTTQTSSDHATAADQKKGHEEPESSADIIATPAQIIETSLFPEWNEATADGEQGGLFSFEELPPLVQPKKRTRTPRHVVRLGRTIAAHAESLGLDTKQLSEHIAANVLRALNTASEAHTEPEAPAMKAEAPQAETTTQAPRIAPAATKATHAAPYTVPAYTEPKPTYTASLYTATTPAGVTTA